MPNSVLTADAGAPASASDERVLDAAKKSGTNVAAAAFVPSRPRPSVQSSNSIIDTSRGPAAASSDGHADRPAQGEEDRCKLNVEAKGFHPKSATQHDSSDSFCIPAVKVRTPVNAASVMLFV